MSIRGAAVFALLALLSAPGLAAPSRKRVDTWLVYGKEPGFERISRLADVLRSISVYGDPPAEWIARCHKLGIAVYMTTGGNETAFDTPEHASATIDGYLKACQAKGFDGIDLDFEELDAKWQDRYSDFLRQVSARLHKAHKRLSHCVALLEGMEDVPPAKVFYDPAVIAKTCDVVRVMCYDLHFAPDHGDPKKPGTGLGPTATAAWARQAMRFWLRHVPAKKLVMGLPAYSNDYPMALRGRGTQVYAPKPDVASGTVAEVSWLPYEQVNQYVYQHADGKVHLFYASDAQSTKALLATVGELKLLGLGFWHFSAVDNETWAAVRAWSGRP